MPAPRSIRRVLAGCATIALCTAAPPVLGQDSDTILLGDGTDGFAQNRPVPRQPLPDPLPRQAFQDPVTGDTVSLDRLDIGTIDPSTPLVLEADAVTYDTQTRVAKAVGEAEAFYGNRVLGADALVYDVANGTVSAQGAVALRNDDGSFLFADDATLATDLTNGTIVQPRILIEGGGKLAAVEGERIDGRYTVLSKAVYSPCDVCYEDPTPLWRVRADRVIHDEVSRDIIYEDATFDVEGVSVFYLPYFRHPDPTVQRRTGFLTPSFSRDDTIGFTAKFPYFLNLAPNRDLTVTPYVTTGDGLILEGEYRARTETGQYRLAGAITYNDARGEGDEVRGALEGEGLFDLDAYTGVAGTYWGYTLDVASDDTFLRRYDYSSDDRTTSRLFVGNQTDRRFAEANVIYFQTFRPEEDDGLIPQVLPEFRYIERVVEDPWYGTVTVEASGLRLEREEGRDYNRVGAEVEWRRPFVTTPGVLITPFADAQADLYLIEDDPVLSENTEIRATGSVGVDLRYPLVAENALGSHVFEPIVQVIAAPNTSEDEIPNEDSLDVEFDEASLFSLESRFPGEDRYEGGIRANVGVRYSYESPSGIGLETVYGRVLRVSDNRDFSSASGLRETVSDHVGATRLTFPPYFDVTHRYRIDGDDLEFRRHEFYGQGRYGRASAGVGYVYLTADPLAGFDEDREEVYGNAALKVTDEWTLYGSGRADIENSRFVFANGGVRFENECCAVDLSLKRRFNDDRDANDDTSVGLNVRLKTLGG